MWLKLNLEDLKFEFKIDKYIPKKEDSWTKVSLHIYMKNAIDYKINYQEILDNYDVDIIRDNLKKLLNDELEEDDELSFAEPDLEFYLSPKQDLRDNPNLVYVKEGHEIADVTMDLKMNLWDEKGALTSNYISTTFDRKEIEAFYYYLCLITNVLDKEDDNIKKLIKDRTIEE